MIGVDLWGVFPLPQLPPDPTEFPSTLYTIYLEPSASLNPEESIAPPTPAEPITALTLAPVAVGSGHINGCAMGL
jgi:hypothetical protein